MTDIMMVINKDPRREALKPLHVKLTATGVGNKLTQKEIETALQYILELLDLTNV